MESCYSCQPLLLFGKDSIHSCCDVQQGVPLGFALTVHPIIERIKAEVPSLGLNAWYLDDSILVGPSEDLVAALRIIERNGPPLGLHLNRGKSLLYIPGEAIASCSPLLLEIPVTRQVFSSWIVKMKASLKALRGMNDSQLETTLLRLCLALPKAAFVLRSCPASHVSNAAIDFDTAIIETLRDIVGGPLSDCIGRG